MGALQVRLKSLKRRARLMYLPAYVADYVFGEQVRVLVQEAWPGGKDGLIAQQKVFAELACMHSDVQRRQEVLSHVTAVPRCECGRADQCAQRAQAAAFPGGGVGHGRDQRGRRAPLQPAQGQAQACQSPLDTLCVMLQDSLHAPGLAVLLKV